MSDIYDEFVADLARWRKTYDGRPREELIRLLLLALEREQLVSIAYGDALVRRRLDAMPVSPEVRVLLRHALTWAWKDEEMHASYIRGLLLRVGSLPLKLLAFHQQIGGAVAGWTSAHRHHVRPSQAPITWALSSFITTAGRLLGKVPSSVRDHLRYQSFYDFCRFNVDAERTAAICWGRLVELAEGGGLPATRAGAPLLPASLLEDFRRMRADESNHEQVFGVLADCIGADDSLQAGVTADHLKSRLGDIGPFFLPPAARASRSIPPGQGGVVAVGQGDDRHALLAHVLAHSGAEEVVAARIAAAGRPLRVAIKVQFMFGYDRRDRSPNTDPALVEALAAWLRARGCDDVAVLESPTLYEHFYAHRSVHEVAAYFGFTSPHYRIVDTSVDQVTHAFERGFGQHGISATWRDADLRIVFGKMRSHPCEMVYLTLGTMDGLGSPAEEFIFAERQVHRQTAVMTMMQEFAPHLALLDAYDNVPDGIVGLLACPRPCAPHRIYAGRDALSVDIVAARHLHLDFPERCGTIKTAVEWFGDPSPTIEVSGINTPITPWRSPCSNDFSAFLSLAAFAAFVFVPGRGALFLPPMDERAFPPLRRDGLVMRVARRVTQHALGMR